MNQNTTKKTIKLLFAMSTLLLASCGNSGQPSSGIHIINAEARYFTQDASVSSEQFTIYGAPGKGDVPYVKVDFLKSLLTSEQVGTFEIKTEGKVATMVSTNNQNAKAIFDAEKNEIRLDHYSQILAGSKLNNGIGFDYCLPKNEQAVKQSSKTSVVNEGQGVVTISLDKYGLNLYAQDGSVFAPLDLLPIVGYSNSHYNFVYNGRDYFKSPAEFTNYPAVGTYCYSGNDHFYYGYHYGGYFYGSNYRKVNAQSGEKYRYAPVDAAGKITEGDGLVLYNDGTGRMLEKVEGVERDREIGGMIWKIAYEEQKDEIVLYILETMAGSEEKASKENHNKTLRINTGKTHYCLSERSQEMADYTYGLLCLNFDYFYGNKEFITKDSFDAYFSSKGLKDRMKSKTVATYSDAMGEFLNKHIGDGHTGIIATSSYQSPERVVINQYLEKYPSERVKKITDRKNLLMPKRFEGLGHNPGYVSFAEIKGDLAMVGFDSFVSDGMPAYISSYRGMESERAINEDTCGYAINAMLEIEAFNANPENKTKVKNVVFDLSCNGGGVMSCMPFLAGIMTADPTFKVKEVTSGKVTEYHYDLNFDGDGQIKTYADKFDFYVLTSSASFSCATALPGMLKGTNVKIIGEKSAGGASPVTFFTDGSGLAYQTSGNDIVCYKDGNEYKSVEEGVPVDYEIPDSIWYDLEKLGAKLNELKSK